MRGRDGVQYANTRVSKCPMFDDACAQRVAALIQERYTRAFETGATSEEKPFDAMALIEEHCGRYVRGAHKGQLRGWAEIEVCTEGGWRRLGPGHGHGYVLRPGQLVSIRITAFDGTCYLEVTR